eukprot:jgi/Mesen1/5606/ME000282S04752
MGQDEDKGADGTNERQSFGDRELDGELCQPLPELQVATPRKPTKVIPFRIRNVVAPMVGQSDLAFRLLCRRHGADVAYTEMFFSERFADDPAYRRAALQTCAEDRPLVVQFCGNRADALVRAAKLVEGVCDAVDINLGCPQQRACQGRYGAYLLGRPDWGTVFEMVRRVSEEVAVPVACKIRLLPTLAMTLEFCRGLEVAGCALLAVHGRTRGSATMRRAGPADLAAIRAIKQALSIPVVANGNVGCPQDVAANLEATGADGIMSAEGVLVDPLLFQGGAQSRAERHNAVLEYLQLADTWQTSMEAARQHVAHMLGRRGRDAATMEQLKEIVNKSVGVSNCGNSSPFVKAL